MISFCGHDLDKITTSFIRYQFSADYVIPIVPLLRNRHCCVICHVFKPNLIQISCDLLFQPRLHSAKYLGSCEISQDFTQKYFPFKGQSCETPLLKSHKIEKLPENGRNDGTQKWTMRKNFWMDKVKNCYLFPPIFTSDSPPEKQTPVLDCDQLTHQDDFLDSILMVLSYVIIKLLYFYLNTSSR